MKKKGFWERNSIGCWSNPKINTLQALNNTNQLSVSIQNENNTNSIFSSLLNTELESSSNPNNIINVPQPTLSYGKTAAELLRKISSNTVQQIINELSKISTVNYVRDHYTDSDYNVKWQKNMMLIQS